MTMITNSPASIGARSYQLQLTGAVNAVLEGHGAGAYTRDGARPEENVPSGSPRLVGAPAGASNVQEGRTKEQEQINQHGLENLDSRRNEIRQNNPPGN